MLDLDFVLNKDQVHGSDLKNVLPVNKTNIGTYKNKKIVWEELSSFKLHCMKLHIIFNSKLNSFKAWRCLSLLIYRCQTQTLGWVAPTEVNIKPIVKTKMRCTVWQWLKCRHNLTITITTHFWPVNVNVMSNSAITYFIW